MQQNKKFFFVIATGFDVFDCDDLLLFDYLFYIAPTLHSNTRLLERSNNNGEESKNENTNLKKYSDTTKIEIAHSTRIT